jgi:hypothetical protein
MPQGAASSLPLMSTLCKTPLSSKIATAPIPVVADISAGLPAGA